MRKLSPVTGFINPNNQERYPVSDSFGQDARKLDAQRMLRALDESEDEIASELREISAIDDQLQYMQAESRLDLEHTLAFGIAIQERKQFREILEDVMRSGMLTLDEAADIASARQRTEHQSENGPES